MFTNYLIYFSILSEEQKSRQILILVIFLIILFTICNFLEFLKLQYLDNTKNSLFQRFLRKL